MSGDRRFSASTRDIDRNIQEAKDIARRAFDRKLGPNGLTALQKGFYNRFLELETQSCHAESNLSTSSCGRRPRSSNQRLLLNAKIGKLHSELSATYKKYAHLVR
jgi:hypothetical protein